MMQKPLHAGDIGTSTFQTNRPLHHGPPHETMDQVANMKATIQFSERILIDRCREQRIISAIRIV